MSLVPPTPGLHGAEEIEPDAAVIVFRPVGLLAALEARRFLALEVGFRQAAQLVAAELGIEVERIPGQGHVILAEAEQAAGAHDDIADLAVELAEHQLADGAELLAVAVEDLSAFDPVGRDQRVPLGLRLKIGIRGGVHRNCLLLDWRSMRAGPRRGGNPRLPQTTS